MSRKIKNIIMIAIIIIVVILSFFTMNDVKNSMGNNRLDRGEFGQRGEIPSGENMPEMPNGGNRPEMPNNGERPEGGFDSSSQTPPQKPEGFDSNNRPNGNMELPSDFKQQDIENMPNNINFKGNRISTSYYILFALEALIISILLVYLIMSNFNKKTVIETLSGTKRLLTYIIVVIVLTVGLTFLQAFLTKNIFIDNSINEMPRNIERFNQNTTSKEGSSL